MHTITFGGDIEALAHDAADCARLHIIILSMRLHSDCKCIADRAFIRCLMSTADISECHSNICCRFIVALDIGTGIGMNCNGLAI